MKHQALFPEKDKSKKIKLSAAIFFGALRVKVFGTLSWGVTLPFSVLPPFPIGDNS